MSISFDKEEYAKEKFQKQSLIVSAMEATLNRTLQAQSFNTWKEIYYQKLKQIQDKIIEKESKCLL